MTIFSESKCRREGEQGVGAPLAGTRLGDVTIRITRDTWFADKIWRNYALDWIHNVIVCRQDYNNTITIEIVP